MLRTIKRDKVEKHIQNFDEIFLWYSNLQRHFNSVHSKPKPFVYDWCGLGFNFAINFQSHTALHSSGKIENNT